MKFVLVLICFFSFKIKTFAYETMVVHGYTNCKVCHYSSTGGGLLNSYGKTLAQEFSSFGEAKEPSERKFEHGLQLRYASLDSNGERRNFPMQADYLAAFKGKGYTVQGTLARTPQDRATDEETSPFLLRKLLVNFNLGRARVELGRDYLNVGLNIIDHTLFIRNSNRRSVDDLVTVGRASFQQGKHNITPFLYLPSYQEAEGNEESGLGFKYEYQNSETQTVLGLSSLLGETDSIKRFERILTVKQSWKKLFFLGQADFTRRENQAGTDFEQEAYYFALGYFLFDSLEFRTSKEKLSLEDPFNSIALRTSYSVRWKPHRYFTLQADRKTSDINDNEFTIVQLFFNGWFL